MNIRALITHRLYGMVSRILSRCAWRSPDAPAGVLCAGIFLERPTSQAEHRIVVVTLAIPIGVAKVTRSISLLHQT